MPGPALLLLLDELNAGAGHSLSHTRRFVADDCVYILALCQTARSGNHMAQKRFAADLMQTLGRRDFNRVPFPAAIIATASFGVDLFDLPCFALLDSLPTIVSPPLRRPHRLARPESRCRYCVPVPSSGHPAPA